MSNDAEMAVLDGTERLYGYRWWGLVYAAMQTGARRGELRRLSRAQVGLDGASVLSTHTKGQWDRAIPLNRKTVGVLSKSQAMRLTVGGPFAGTEGHMAGH